MGQVRGNFEKDAALMQGLADELILLNIELEKCFFEVPHTAMNELRRARACAYRLWFSMALVTYSSAFKRRTTREIVSFNKGDLESATCSVESTPNTSCAGTDNQEVKLWIWE